MGMRLFLIQYNTGEVKKKKKKKRQSLNFKCLTKCWIQHFYNQCRISILLLLTHYKATIEDVFLAFAYALLKLNDTVTLL